MNVIGVDLDGTLFTGNMPIPRMINVVNNLFEDRDNFIVIYTARSYSIFHETRELLIKNDVKFHALVMEKMRATCYIDDLAKHPAGV